MNESVSNNTWQWYKGVVLSWLEHPGAEEHEGLNITALRMDQAYMVAASDKDVGVYSVSDDCFRVSVYLYHADCPERVMLFGLMYVLSSVLCDLSPQRLK